MNRFPDHSNVNHTVHVMKYLFPRQFGLHNVFTCTVDSNESIQPFKDYTLREEEITQLKCRKGQKGGDGASSIAVKQRVPKRLRGEALDLVRKLQRLHSRCSYHNLLNYYCPSKVGRITSSCTVQFHNTEQQTRPCRKRVPLIERANLEPEHLRSQLSGLSSCSSLDAAIPQVRVEAPRAPLVSLATPHSNVSAFCQAVLSNLIPNRFWGQGTQGQENKDVVMQNIDRFVRLRRFENLSLHVVSQGLKVDISSSKARARTDFCS